METNRLHLKQGTVPRFKEPPPVLCDLKEYISRSEEAS